MVALHHLKQAGPLRENSVPDDHRVDYCYISIWMEASSSSEITVRIGISVSEMIG